MPSENDVREALDYTVKHVLKGEATVRRVVGFVIEHKGREVFIEVDEFLRSEKAFANALDYIDRELAS